ncbi:MAG: NAD(+)/NADH kinase [Eggerthellaceae bacterium]
MDVLIIQNESNPKAVDASHMLMAFLASQGIDSVIIGAYDEFDMQVEDFGLIVSLGGDGTMLRASHIAGTSGVPILGLNFGHLGFLVNKSDNGVIDAVTAAICGDVVREERTNFVVEVLCDGDDENAFDSAFCSPDMLPEGRRFRGLNEAALTRGPSGRIIDLSYSVSGEHVASIRSDGIVVATATGSTAYALSVGGPLVAPGFGGLVIVPVAPHTLVARALLTDPQDVVEIELESNSANNEATLIVDGEMMGFETPIRRIRVFKGEEPTVMLQYRKEGFYEHVSNVFFK